MWRSPAGAPFRARTRNGPPDQGLGELAGVPDRRRAADDDRMAAVVRADPEQPAEDVGDVPAEHATIGVQLVDDDVAQLFEQLEPLGVMGQDRRMEHVRVGRDDLAGAPDRRPDRSRRVAVVGRCRDVHAGCRGELGELGDLVLRERLGGEEQERPGGRVLRDGLKDRQGIAQGLARRGRRDDDDVLARPGPLDGFRLVDVRTLDAARREAGHDPRIEPVRKVRVFRLASGHDRVMDDAAGERRLVQHLGQDGGRLRGGVDAHAAASGTEQMCETRRV